MSNHRFFLTALLEGDSSARLLPLSEADVRHAVRVLRIKPGETIEVVDPQGAVWLVRVVAAGTAGVEAEVVAQQQLGGEFRRPHVTLFQGVAKGEKMDDIVRQAVEVGAAGVVPVRMSRSVVKLDAAKRVERGSRWRRIAESAAKQAHRNSVPPVADPVDFAEAASLLNGYTRVVVLWEECRDGGLAEALADTATDAGAEVALVVGPEGGLSAEEVAVLVAQGARVASLGPSVLRTETAAVVALALAIHELGGMGSRR